MAMVAQNLSILSMGADMAISKSIQNINAVPSPKDNSVCFCIRLYHLTRLISFIDSRSGVDIAILIRQFNIIGLIGVDGQLHGGDRHLYLVIAGLPSGQQLHQKT